MNEFSYISEKIKNAEFRKNPFKHILIEDFLKKEHLDIILSDKQIHFDDSETTEDLIDVLHSKNYKVQNFPGCTTDLVEYLNHYNNDSFPHGRKGTPIESYGVTFRLEKIENELIQELTNYLNGKEFKETLEEKFKIEKETRIITAIQKNLSHYEISPHPDVREKQLTYLLNINKDSSIDDESIHTNLLRFKSEWEFIKDYWKNNHEKNTTWIPWDWCETKVITNKNNSIVLFKPSTDTLHAVKMIYDHTKFQRTQLYGNLMGLGAITEPMNYRDLIEFKENNS
tara:strand:- start:4662 stop:5513 length:852 start_codon:yes stop_codon:yes gene_type:complete